MDGLVQVVGVTGLVRQVLVLVLAIGVVHVDALISVVHQRALYSLVSQQVLLVALRDPLIRQVLRLSQVFLHVLSLVVLYALEQTVVNQSGFKLFALLKLGVRT